MVTVLIVDDSIYSRSIISKILLESSYDHVVEASNGEEALKEYQKSRPDLVLLDIVMPGGTETKNGLETLKQIMTVDHSAKIVVCSALEQEVLAEKALDLGAKGFISKPFNPEELLKVLSTLDITTAERGVQEEKNTGIAETRV
jgi:two-component system chemotaxis response regulator CheY